MVGVSSAGDYGGRQGWFALAGRLLSVTDWHCLVIAQSGKEDVFVIPTGPTSCNPLGCLQPHSGTAEEGESNEKGGVFSSWSDADREL